MWGKGLRNVNTDIVVHKAKCIKWQKHHSCGLNIGWFAANTQREGSLKKDDKLKYL